MLTAYVDESGIHGGSEVCAIAGFVGRSEEWEVLSRKWRQVCEKWGVPGEQGFHMADFENRRPPYDRWSETHGRELLRELLQVVKGREVRGFGSGVLMSDFNRLCADDRSVLTHSHPDRPYFLCLQHCLVEAAHFADGLPDTELVAFVFDRQDEYHKELTQIYDEFRGIADWPLHRRLAGVVATANRRETPALQAADLAAYECYKGMLNLYGSHKRDTRWSMKELLKRKFAVRLLGYDVLKEIVALKRAESEARG
ncbi:MAG TPA: DUF3800 domain-containing protein [Planctomycetaceae bacterium]